MRLEPNFNPDRDCSLGDIVQTPYGHGVVAPVDGGKTVNFEDGSGCSIHEAYAIVGDVETPPWNETFGDA